MDKTITFTGHRPNKLYGYDLRHPSYLALNKILETLLEEKILEGYNIFISGGALGFDTVAFLSVKNLKKKYPHIKNILAIPFENQYIKWSEKDIKCYKKMKQLADDIIYVDSIGKYNRTNTNIGVYHKDKLKIRNEYMVDNSDLLIALWDKDKNSGTYHCISYAIKNNLDYLVINPTTLSIT